MNSGGNRLFFIRDRLQDMPAGSFANGEARLYSIFCGQLGDAATADVLITQSGNSITQTYRKWLGSYIDKKICLIPFYAKNPPTESLELLFLIEKIMKVKK